MTLKNVMILLIFILAAMTFANVVASQPGQGRSYTEFTITKTVTTTATMGKNRVRLTIPAGAVIHVLAEEEKTADSITVAEVK